MTSPIQWLQANAAPVRTVDPSDEDFSDLEPLRAAIGDARVVMLGEQSHGDGAVFLAKARLIKFLHRQMRFDVLAFESGLFDCARAWDHLAAGEDPDEAFRRGVFGIWAGSAQLKPLTDYLGTAARSARPLELAGFDSQFTASASRDFLITELEAFLASRGMAPDTLEGWAGNRAILSGVIRNGYREAKPSAERQSALLAMLDSLHARVAQLEPGPRARYDSRFWAQALKSMSAEVRRIFARDPAAPFRGTDNNPRDAQMADNFLWLARQRYPHRRIIVWAATMHIMRNPEIVTGMHGEDLYRGLVNMGHLVWREMGSETYGVGFIASEGMAGQWRSAPWKLPAIPSGSLEALWAGTMHQVALLDFRQRRAGDEWLRAPLLTGALGYAPMRADWTYLLDGLVYIRHMTPSTPAKPHPPAAPMMDGNRDVVTGLKNDLPLATSHVMPSSVLAEQQREMAQSSTAKHSSAPRSRHRRFSPRATPQPILPSS